MEAELIDLYYIYVDDFIMFITSKYKIDEVYASL